MSVKINSNIEQNLNSMEKKIKQVQKRALEKTGEFVAQQLENKTPIDRNSPYTHAKDNVVFGLDSTGERMEIGYDKKVAWRIHFVEMGTIHQKPRGFILRTFTQNETKIMDMVSKEYRNGLNL